ncbi:TRAP transporter substrate-binding protein [Desulfotomaculum nigrificans]|uniref:TRAP transporter substrate-binding protein n=1 Tax=Desulfotomaculum nigrificans TaxID=1565 RepID=UPI0001FAE70B|nr:TRAP transporter substrate-binding protein [Desulfotomaculum nigrificans]
MGKKRALITLAIVTLILSLIIAGCGSGSKNETAQGNKQDGQKIVMKFAAVNNGTHPAVEALKKVFKPRVEELTRGKVEVQIFDNAQLGGERDVMEQLQLGTVQGSYISPVLGSIEPKINILDLPFLFKDEQHVDKVLDGPVGEKLLADLPSKGMRCLGYMENGFRVITNSKRPINKLEDLKGLKIRTPEAPVSVAIFKSLGANATPLAFSELYSALQQGVVDGQENAYNTVASSSFFEVQKYVAETNHMWGSYAILVSEKWWQGLPKDVQEAIAQAAKEASKEQRKIFREKTAQSKQTCIDKGMQVTQPDLTEFVKAVQPVYDDMFKQHPDFKTIVDEIMKLK